MLIGDQICLGPVLQADAPSFFNWLNNVELVHGNGAYRPTDQARFDHWFGGIPNDNTRVVFTIRAKADVRLMGYVQIINIQPVMRSAEIGMLIGDPQDRGKGVGQEAMRLALTFCWRDLNLRRVTLFIVGDNPAAQAAYAKTGFEVEGRLRQATYVNGAYRDITVMGILRPDDVPAGPTLI